MTQNIELANLTLDDASKQLASGSLHSQDLAEAYIAQIERIDPKTQAVLEINPDAIEQACELDNERAQGKVRGALHGIPILLKDNIDTAGSMSTSAGSVALKESIAPEDAFVTQRLREAGALILGKTNLSEWANMRSSRSSTGWSSRGGQTRNPFDLNRSPGGSSSGSGVAVAAGMCAAAVGTETNGSVVIPASMNSLVGIKPSIGLVSRTGIIPISHSQDTAGPIARSVKDAAILLGGMLGFDPEDSLSREVEQLAEDLLKLSPHALKGARVGVLSNFIGYHDGVDALMHNALRGLNDCGATVINPVEYTELDQLEDNQDIVLCHELKAGLKAYLARLGPNAPMKSLEDLIRFNLGHSQQTMPYFKQDLFLAAQATGSLEDKLYLDAFINNKQLAREEGIDALLARDSLDVLVAPTIGPPWAIDLVNGDHRSPCSSALAAIAGYPHVTVPAGFVHDLPVGLSFFANDLSDAKVVQFAYAFEQHTQHRRAPALAGT